MEHPESVNLLTNTPCYLGGKSKSSVPPLQLLGVAAVCMLVGFGATYSSLQPRQLSIGQPIQVASRNAVIGATVASLAAGHAFPAAAAQPMMLPTDVPSVHAEHVAYLATVADAPPVVDAPTDPFETAQLAVLALFIPILGYGSWRFGQYKAKETMAEAAKKYKADLESGNYVKVSPSGMPTVKGLPLGSDAGWKMQCDELRARGIQGVSAAELKELVKSGVTVVDVRAKDRFLDSAIPGSINIPLFQPIDGWDLYKLARRVQFLIFGVAGTEYNPRFMDEFKAQVGSKTGDIVFIDDSVRGTLRATEAFPDGKAGHALMAIFLATNAGFKNTMKYTEGGIIEYAKADGEIVAPAS